MVKNRRGGIIDASQRVFREKKGKEGKEDIRDISEESNDPFVRSTPLGSNCRDFEAE